MLLTPVYYAREYQPDIFVYLTQTFNNSSSDFSECFEENIRYIGPSVLNEPFTGAPDARGCSQLCFDSSDCDYFAFNNQTNQCFLMVSTAIGGRRPSAYWISGPFACRRPKSGWYLL